MSTPWADRYPHWRERGRRGFLLLAVPLLLLGLAVLAGGLLALHVWPGRPPEPPAANPGDVAELQEKLEALEKELASQKGLVNKLASKPGPTPPPRVDLGPLEERLNQVEQGAKALGASRDEAREALAKLQKDVARLGKPATGARPELTDAQLRKLTKHLEAFVKTNLKPPPSTGAPKALVDQVGALEKRLEAQEQKVEKELKSARRQAQGAAEKLRQAQASLTGKQKELDGVKARLARSEQEAADKQKELRGARGALKKAEAALAKLPVVEPTDVLVLALNSRNWSVNPYRKEFRELVDPDKATVVRGMRVGLSVFQGIARDVRVPLGEADPKTVEAELKKFEQPRDEVTDDLPALRNLVLGEFKSSEARRRCVVVASTACPVVPATQLKAWEGLPTHVILIGSDSRASELDTRRLLQWHAFCRNCGGSLTLLSSRGELKGRDEALAKQLLACLKHATQPVYIRPKGEKR
jgi:hypothetical protein